MTTTKKDLKKLESYGFDTSPDRSATVNTLPRLTIAVNAMEKCGKTSFGLSAPKPIAYFNFDRKIEQAALDAIGVDPQDIIIKEVRVDGELEQDQHMDIWEEVRKAFKWALEESESVRSIVIDTESEMWELIRLAYFGKLTKVMPYQYTEVNSIYKYMLDRCDRFDKNIILLRKLKKQYKNDKWNGKYEPAGFGKVKDIMQVNGEMYVDEDEGITFEILTNGLQAELNHETYSGVMCSFPYVAAMLTGTDVEEWE